MFKKRFFIRYFLLTAIFIFAVVIYGGQLLNIQIANGGQYQIANTDDETSTQTFVVSAVRGEIFDRNGVPLVTNRNIYNLAVDGLKLNSATANTDTSYLQIVIDLVNLVNSSGGTVEQDTLPVIDFENPDGTHSYAYSMVVSSSGSNPRDTLNKFLQDNNLSVDESADQLITFLDGKYKIDDYLPPENRDPKLFRKIVGICYDFDRYHVLRGDRRYTLSKDINAQLMTVIKEDSHDYPGAEVDLSYERVYNYPSVMPHLMGTIGLIDAKNVDQYLAKGYSMDATVGKSGIELAFEDYLRGQDGKLVRTYDKDGNVIEEEWKKDANGNEMKPVPGKNVYLTIDIKLQQVAEHSLAKTIDRIHQLAAQGSQPDLNGATANAGAAAVIDPNNGEILALPTYPSYNLLDLKDTVKYAALAADNDNSPLLNRALFGRYAPGSIFKIATSVAALCSGNLTTTDQIEDKGVYMRYANADGTGYTPACWLWNMNHTTHGWEDITKAIRNSCNYFFFVVADRMGINKIDEYAKHLGLGEPTGIELGEDTGILSSPEYAGANGKQWSPGQVLATAIGQSYNVFTPLQMVTMLGAVLDDGTRYASHLLLRVEEYGSDDNIYSDSAPKIMDQITIPDSYLAAIKQGMYEVFETGGTASTLFQSFPSSFTVGGKTGTAQINEALVSDNATCVAFAPFDKPEIAISSVIEKGAKGAYAGYVAEDVCAYYFGYKTFNESMDLPDEPTTDDTTDTTDVGN